MAAENEVDADAKLMLADMRGDIRLINDRHSRYTDDVKRIEERHNQDVKRIDERLHTHGNRIGSLEAKDHVRVGERQGLALGAKVIHWIIGGGIIALLGAAAKLAGAL